MVTLLLLLGLVIVNQWGIIMVLWGSLSLGYGLLHDYTISSQNIIEQNCYGLWIITQNFHTIFSRNSIEQQYHIIFSNNVIHTILSHNNITQYHHTIFSHNITHTILSHYIFNNIITQSYSHNITHTMLSHHINQIS